MRRVILESPYAGDSSRNVRYARACVRDCLLRGEAPIASHLLYAQQGILDDTVPAERELGIAAGLEWGRFAEATVVYTDYGISRGMQHGINRAVAEGRPVEHRRLPNLVKLTEGACEGRVREHLSLYDAGEMTDEFALHINTCVGCKAVSERVFEGCANDFRRLSQALKEGK